MSESEELEYLNAKLEIAQLDGKLLDKEIEAGHIRIEIACKKLALAAKDWAKRQETNADKST